MKSRWTQVLEAFKAVLEQFSEFILGWIARDDQHYIVSQLSGMPPIARSAELQSNARTSQALTNMEAVPIISFNVLKFRGDGFLAMDTGIGALLPLNLTE